MIREQRNLFITAAIICGLSVGLASGCNLISKAAKGEDIGRADLVRSAEQQHQDYEQEQEQIEATVDNIEQLLGEIQDFREQGRFSPAEMRERRLNAQLDNLEDLDSSHEMLDDAPAELEQIKSEYSREVYEKRALAEECEHTIAQAREQRMREQWRRVDRGLTNYAQCRRRFVDLAGDASALTDADDTYGEEIEVYSDYLIENIETTRKNSRFNVATSTERNLANHLEYYEEVIGDEDFVAATDARVDELRETYRDPAVVEAEQAEDAFYAWRDRAGDIFEDQLNQIQSAEEQARPMYEEARELMDDGAFEEALDKLQQARTTLYENAYSSGVAMETAVTNRTIERGLSYEIAAAIAEIHFHQGDRAQMYPELSIIQNGRTWFDEDEEFQIYLYQVLADRDGDMVPQPTSQVRRYAGEFSDTAAEYRRTAERADVRSGEAYAMLGVNLEPISERRILLNADDATGEVIHLEQQVDSVSGGQMQFDFRQTRNVPTNCRSTGEVVGANVYTGEVRYRQECDSREIEEGYVLSAPTPDGVQVRSGDIVEIYATVGNVSGDTVRLNDPGVVRVMRNGETAFYLGVDY